MRPFQPEEFTILVVDDMPPNLHLLCSILENEGYVTIFTNRGKQALELVKQANPDLILLDLMMPEMNGLEVCEYLKSDPNTRDIPVIFLTGSNEKNNLLTAFQIGAVDYITKPFINEELLARVHTHLKLKKSNSQLKQTLSELIEARDLALESVQIKTRFLANMSHEIRTPMNALLGLTEVLKTTNLNSQQSECVNMIQSSSNQLLSLVNDLLDFSKLEAGAMRIESLAFELNSVIEDVKNMLIHQANIKGLKLCFNIDDNLQLNLLGDAYRLRQILINLINNAIKFTPVGKVNIAVKLSEILPTDSEIMLEFSITDTGIGISEEDQVKLFKSFSQVDGSITRKYGGTGLGLSICKQLVELMNGTIGCISEVGKGAKFWFNIPFKLGNTAPNVISPITTERKSPIFTNKIKILLVEDNLTNQKVISMQLQHLGYEADCVNNGQEALDKLETFNYDIMFLDGQMPVLDGYQTMEQLRDNEGEKHHQIVIGLTANAGIAEKQKCLDYGMDDYLSKPVLIQDLSNMIDKWMTLKIKDDQKSENNSDFLIPTPANNQPIDLEYVNQLFGGDEQIARKILRSFMETTHKYLTTARADFATHNILNMLKQIHNIKGSSGTFSAKSLSEIAREIEIQSLNNHWDKVEELLENLTDEFNKLTEFIKLTYPDIWS